MTIWSIWSTQVRQTSSNIYNNVEYEEFFFLKIIEVFLLANGIHWDYFSKQSVKDNKV